MTINLKFLDDKMTVESFDDNAEMVELTIGKETYCGSVSELFQVITMLENIRLERLNERE